MDKGLDKLLEYASREYPANIALQNLAGINLSYQQYNEKALEISGNLRELAPKATRICVLSYKSIESLIVIQAILKTGACYVPLNPFSPIHVSLDLFFSGGFDLLIINKDLAPPEMLNGCYPRIVLLNSTFLLVKTEIFLKGDESLSLAYILYTSGSTGKPKAVMAGHHGVWAFLDWCSNIFKPTPTDVFSSIAPWCFDLSILDIFLPIKHGSTLVVLTEKETQNPRLVMKGIYDFGITNIYATPTFLKLLVAHGQINKYAYSPRQVVFAGESFPIKRLNELRMNWPEASYYNFYGPTETNVCTYYQLPKNIEIERKTPYPIGRPCDYAEIMIKDGILCVKGPCVMKGYYQNPVETENCMLIDQSGRWYKTGDIVRQDKAGNLIFVGRKDRQIKRRGYRIEMDELEVVICNYEGISMCGVVDYSSNGEALIGAAIVMVPNSNFSLTQIKEHLIKNTETYKIPDKFIDLPSLPQTVSGKVDYAKLRKIFTATP